MNFTDLELVEGSLKGIESFQRLLYDKYNKRMLGICMRYSRQTMEAEDVMVQTFAKVFSQLHTYRGGQFEAWLKRIFVRESINHYHKNKKQTWYNSQEPDYEIPSVETNEILSMLGVEEIMKLVNALPDGARLIFNLYAIEGYTHQEIGAMLNISDGTSKSQYSRAKELLRSQLESKYEWKKEVF